MEIQRFRDDEDGRTEMLLCPEDLRALENACLLARRHGGGAHYRSLAAAFRLARKHYPADEPDGPEAYAEYETRSVGLCEAAAYQSVHRPRSMSHRQMPHEGTETGVYRYTQRPPEAEKPQRDIQDQRLAWRTRSERAQMRRARRMGIPRS